MAANEERTFMMIKPDGVQRGLVGEILKRFEAKGLKLVALKFFCVSFFVMFFNENLRIFSFSFFIFSSLAQPTKEILEKHYVHSSTLSYFPELIRYMTSGPVCVSVWEGSNAIKTGRQLIGNSTESIPGTIRGTFSLHYDHQHRNIIHGSDAVEAAKSEIDLWFNEKELVSRAPAINNWTYK